MAAHIVLHAQKKVLLKNNDNKYHYTTFTNGENICTTKGRRFRVLEAPYIGSRLVTL